MSSHGELGHNFLKRRRFSARVARLFVEPTQFEITRSTICQERLAKSGVGRFRIDALSIETPGFMISLALEIFISLFLEILSDLCTAGTRLSNKPRACLITAHCSPTIRSSFVCQALQCAQRWIFCQLFRKRFHEQGVRFKGRKVCFARSW